MRLGDRDLSAEPPHRIARAGLARTFQNLRLFANLSVRENVDLAALSAGRYRPRRAAGRRRRAARRRRPRPTWPTGRRARSTTATSAGSSWPAPPRWRPTYLLLDEPTSGMSDDESLAMVDHVRATAGVGRRRRARHRPRPGVHHPHQRPRRRARRGPRARRGHARRGPPPTPPSPPPTSAHTAERKAVAGFSLRVALAVIACSVRTVVSMSSTSNWLSNCVEGPLMYSRRL